MSRELPVLPVNPPFRGYPIPQRMQPVVGGPALDPKQVCNECSSGMCCAQSESPIHLSAHDVIRLAHYFNLTPAAFMERFTQDTFEGEDKETRAEIAAYNEGNITFLRTTTGQAVAPCIFKKYRRRPDGSVASACSVHPARPLSCREFYFDACKERPTGEWAAVVAEGYDLIQQGIITPEMVQQRLIDGYKAEEHRRYQGKEAFALWTVREIAAAAFWREMYRALNPEETNETILCSHGLDSHQDRLTDKMNRLLSAKNYRFEDPDNEDNGPYPVRPFTDTAEYDRLMRITNRMALVTSKGMLDFHRGPYFATDVGVRTLLTEEPLNAFKEAPLHSLGGIQRRIAMGTNHIIRMAGRLLYYDRHLDEEVFLSGELMAVCINFRTTPAVMSDLLPYLEEIEGLTCTRVLDYFEREIDGVIEDPDPEFVMDAVRHLHFLFYSPLVDKTRVDRCWTAVQRMAAGLSWSALSPCPELNRNNGSTLTAEEWDQWFYHVLEARDLLALGFLSDGMYDERLSASIALLERTPFKMDYAPELLNVATHIGYSLSFYNHIVPVRQTEFRTALLDRLATYALRLTAWRMQQPEPDPESMSEFIDAVYASAGKPRSFDPAMEQVVALIARTQAMDGSWHMNPLGKDQQDDQEHYLYESYHAAWACVDALRWWLTMPL